MGTEIKIKKSKPLPLYIEHAVLLSYVIAIFAGTVFLQLLIAIGIGNTRNVAMITFAFLAPILGFSVGWYLKFKYVSKNEDDSQLSRIKAQFWGAMAFILSFVISLLLIFMILIKLENTVLPESVSDPIVFTLSMSIMGVSLYIANNSKKRIYRNFSYM